MKSPCFAFSRPLLHYVFCNGRSRDRLLQHTQRQPLKFALCISFFFHYYTALIELLPEIFRVIKYCLPASSIQPVRYTPSMKQSSTTIPFPKSHVRRTGSELQFYQGMQEAEARDNRMFHRLISGLQIKTLEHASKIPMSVVDREFIERQTKETIERIIQHRSEQLQGATPISAIVNMTETHSRPLRARNRGSHQPDDHYGFFSDLAEGSDNEGDGANNEDGENLFDLDL
jgi:hypothetical protein